MEAATRQASARPAIIDVDTGVDDAAALALATRLPELNLLGVTTVAGNVALEQTTENTRRVLAAVGRADVPVYRGMSGPLARPLHDASEFHGANGLGGVELPPSPRPLQAETAPEFLVQSGRRWAGELVLVCVGPQTNLAVALSLEPELPRLLRRVVVMGGAFQSRGNSTPFAEFNIWADPEAAAKVALSALPLTYVGLDVTHQARLSRGEWQALEHSQKPLAQLIHSLLRRTFVERGQESFPMHDPLAVAVARQPSLVETRRVGVTVQAGLCPNAGQTTLSELAPLPRHEVALGVDAAQFLELFWQRLGLG